MLRLCFTCVLLVLPFVVVADPIPVKEHGLETATTPCIYRCLGEEDTLQLFEGFRAKYNRNYGEEEYLKRFKTFKQNLETIDRLNYEEKGTAKYGVTRFADMTYDEFTYNFTGGRLSEEAWKSHAEQMEAEPEVEIEFVDNDFETDVDEDSEESDEELVETDGKVYIPKKFDYRKKRAVTPVKNQGLCGSCWAFSVMANIEGVWAKNKKQLLDLSEQELVDCDKVDHGCNGGWMPEAVKELVRIGGIAKSSSYPYLGMKQACRFTSSMTAAKVAGTRSISTNEKKIARALVKIGPLSVAVVASDNFMFYESGLFDPTQAQCSSDKKNVNHGVALVGYGQEKVNNKIVPFWVVKNSWGSAWGEGGYMKIVRGKGACAINSYVSTAYL